MWFKNFRRWNLDVYRKSEITVVEASTYTNIGVEELKHFLKGKQSIFVGNSSVRGNHPLPMQLWVMMKSKQIMWAIKTKEAGISLQY